MAKKEAPTHVTLPDPVDLNLRSSKYQPTKAEKEKAIDMPGANIETVHAAFFRPIRAVEK